MNRNIKFLLNDKLINEELNPALSMLDFIRKSQNLTGTKEGCREGDCGACTVMVGSLIENKVVYKNINSCLFPIADAQGKHIVTIEGLNSECLTPVQNAFVKETATQCGFCTPGFIISLTCYMINADSYSFDDAVDYIAGNVCRCTGHTTIKRAVESVLNDYQIADKENRIKYLINKKFLPDYFESVTDKLSAVKESIPVPVNNDKKYLVSGGTDLYVQRWEDLLESEIDVYPSSVSENKITLEGNTIVINGNTTINEIKESVVINNYIPELKELLKLFGSLPIRNRATVAGNIINASPIGDMVNILMVLDANLILSNGIEERSIPLTSFYKGYKNVDKNKDEILIKVSLPIPVKGSVFNFEKVSRRTHLDIASVNSSILVKAENGIIESVKISAGGVGPVPTRLNKLSGYLQGKAISSSILKNIDEMLKDEISPITDARGSADYKALLLKQLIIKHFIKLFPEAISVEELV